jgi:hypothetical protein
MITIHIFTFKMPEKPDKITSESSPNQLPKDVNTLQQMVVTLLGQIDDLNGQLHYLKRQLFGSVSYSVKRVKSLILLSDYYSKIYIISSRQRKSRNSRPVQRITPGKTKTIKAGTLYLPI